MNVDNYFIKQGYVSHTIAQTFDEESNTTYWTPYRLSLAKIFQYYVYRYAKELIQHHQIQSLLDIGSGPPMKLAAMIEPMIDDITLMDQPNVEEIALEILPSATFIATNLETITPNIARKFPMIICADVIEHLLNPQPTMNFIYDHLEPNGYAILSTPERDFLRGYDCMQSPKKEHVREWNQAEFRLYVESCGFDVIAHEVYPQKMINPILFIFSRTIPKFVWTKSTSLRKQWGGCQMIVCQRRD